LGVSNAAPSSTESSDEERVHRQSSSAAKAPAPAVAALSSAAPGVGAAAVDPGHGQLVAAEPATASADFFSQALGVAMRGLDQHRANLYNGQGENMAITRSAAMIRSLPKAGLTWCE
jgi:hypothetical protein